MTQVFDAHAYLVSMQAPRVMLDQDAVRLDDGRVITAQQMLDAVPHEPPLTWPAEIEALIARELQREYALSMRAMTQHLYGDDGPSDRNFGLKALLTDEQLEALEAGPWDDDEPTPVRVRQYPSHQGYDHLVAMRNLEED